jgi:hypothetical protein
MLNKILLKLKQWKLQTFPQYRRLEYRELCYDEANELIKACADKPYEQQWHVAKEEDTNRCFSIVCLERRERILQ